MAIVVVLLLLLVMGGKASISAPGTGAAGIRPPASSPYPPGYSQYAPNPYAYQTGGISSSAISSGISALGSFLSHQTSSTPAGPSAAFTSDGLLTPSFAQPDAGALSSYNNISTSDLDTLASGDAAMGVEGPF